MAKGGVTVKVEDKKLKALRAKLKAEPKALRVGILEVEASETYADTSKTVGEVANWNEFGTQDIPARSFIRDWLTEKKVSITRQLGKDYYAVLFEGGDETTLLSARGKQYTRQIVSRIKKVIRPLNTLATLRTKQGATPLIDTKTLIKAIRWDVKE